MKATTCDTLVFRTTSLLLLCPQLRRSWWGISVSGSLYICPCIRSKHACHILWTVHARVLKFHIYVYIDSLWKNSWHMFFFLSELSPFLELCPFEKIRMKSDACHILWTVHARVLKFHVWIPNGKIADSYVYSCRSYLAFWRLWPIKNLGILFCKHYLSKSIWARGLKLGQLIGDDE